MNGTALIPALRFTRQGGLHVLEADLWLPRPLAEVFPFFADAMNLEAITPASLRFTILTPPPIEMRQGARIDYQLRVSGVPVRWQSEITAWDPPHRFVDEQCKGPYRVWIHEHLFEERAEGTLVQDRVRYAVPGGALAERLLIRPQLRAIFAHRQTVIPQLLA